MLSKSRSAAVRSYVQESLKHAYDEAVSTNMLRPWLNKLKSADVHSYVQESLKHVYDKRSSRRLFRH